jgi:hypothetical protein
MDRSIPQEVVNAFREPSRLAELPERTWSELIPWIRRTGLEGEVAALCEAFGECLPEGVRDQLEASRRLVKRQNQLITNEIRELQEVLEGRVSTVLLLKGAAYLALGLPNAASRISSDIDLMVPRHELESTEQCLIDAGWEAVPRSVYDQHYYRDWMHEIPPLRHRERGTFVDLHHAITPPVSRLRIPSEPLFDAMRPVPGSGFHVLSPPDMVLHSACHLLSDGEFSHGLRDFRDIHLLVEHFGCADPDFWRALAARASEFRLERTLFYTVSFLEQSFGTGFPSAFRRHVGALAPPRPVHVLMDAAIRHAVLPAVPARFGDRLAENLMIARSHYLRMPLHLLVPHLVRKSLLRVRKARSPT